MTRKKNIVLVVMFIVTLAIVVFLVKNNKKVINICIPFLIAITIVYIIKPILIRLERIKIPNKYGILIIYAIFLGVLICFVIFVLPKFLNNTKQLIIKMPEITVDYQSKFYKFINGLKIEKWPKEMKNLAVEKIKLGTKNMQDFLIRNLKSILMAMLKIVTKFFDLILGMIIAYYFIVDEQFFKNMFLMLAPKRFRNDISFMGRKISEILASFIRGQLLTAFIVGMLITIGLLVLRVEYALPLGLISGIANIIPYFGPIIGAIPAILVALLISPVKALWVTGLILLIQQIDNVFISPKIIEGKLGLHPVTTILSVLIGGEFFGIFGMLFSVLIVAIIKVISNRVFEKIV